MEFNALITDFLRVFLQVALPLTAIPIIIALMAGVICRFVSFSDEGLQYTARSIGLFLAILVLGGSFYASVRSLFETVFLGG